MGLRTARAVELVRRARAASSRLLTLLFLQVRQSYLTVLVSSPLPHAQELPSETLEGSSRAPSLAFDGF